MILLFLALLWLRASCFVSSDVPFIPSEMALVHVPGCGVHARRARRGRRQRGIHGLVFMFGLVDEDEGVSSVSRRRKHQGGIQDWLRAEAAWQEAAAVVVVGARWLHKKCRAAFPYPAHNLPARQIIPISIRP
ncbi:hypothetical protein E2C01_058153 [Portunus trituberculatus]|uniref:Secreted protein n=1 Tax=Portunus trituberculatus TaxID=210409 RepID=A0A5B7H1W1_PORTR|nr:hypothetical protein [Portunus trituberculatus]